MRETLADDASSHYNRAVFTGLIEEIGTLRSRFSRGPGAALVIGTTFHPLVLGESIAVQGVCLTVERIVSGGFEASASAETLARSSLGRLSIGARVHLERALPANGRLGGHIVSGHVDGSATLVERTSLGEALKLTFEAPRDLLKFIAEKGSIAIDGASLTVNHVDGSHFDLVVVPFTQTLTLLGSYSVGDQVNVEVDILARYVARYLEVGRDQVGQRADGEHSEHGERNDAQQRDERILQRLRDAGIA
ncbi:MAG: riboflavin synthase [Polyangiaceae bacterium]